MNEVALAAELVSRHGVTTRQRLRGIGLSDRAITGLIGRGRLRVEGRGVYVDAAAPDSFARRVALACALTGGVASHHSALEFWQFRKRPRSPDVHITVDWRRRIAARRLIAVHRSCQLRDSDVVRRRDGIAVTTPPRTVFDAAGFVEAPTLESMIEQGIDREMFAVATLMRVIERLGRSGRHGSGAIKAVLASRETWWKPVRSDYELRLERALRRRGFPPLVREHPVEIAPGKVVHPHLGLPDDGLFIEVDHHTWHGGRHESAYDRCRDLKVRLTGVHVERVPDIAIDNSLDETVEDLWRLWQKLRGVF